MPQESYRDHGVSGQHWLLDEELASLSKGPAARPAAREPVEVAPLPAVAVNGGAAVPPRGNFVVLVAGLVTALLVYALLSNAAVVGAFEDVFPRDGARALSTSAADAPRASELAEFAWPPCAEAACDHRARPNARQRACNAEAEEREQAAGTAADHPRNPAGDTGGRGPPLPELKAPELRNVPELP